MRVVDSAPSKTEFPIFPLTSHDVQIQKTKSHFLTAFLNVLDPHRGKRVRWHANFVRNLPTPLMIVHVGMTFSTITATNQATEKTTVGTNIRKNSPTTWEIKPSLTTPKNESAMKKFTKARMLKKMANKSCSNLGLSIPITKSTWPNLRLKTRL